MENICVSTVNQLQVTCGPPHWCSFPRSDVITADQDHFNVSMRCGPFTPGAHAADWPSSQERFDGGDTPKGEGPTFFFPVGVW